MYNASLLTRTFAFSTELLAAIGTFLISIAFHMLLYLWSVFLMQIKHNRSVYYFRGLIVFGMLVVTLTFLVSVIVLNMEITPILRTLMKVMGYLLPITQVLIAVAFLGYAVKFMRRRETVKISPQTYQALTRLGQVAIVAFICYFAVAATNLNAVTSSLLKPGPLVTIIILRMVSASVRGLALLTVLGVRSPKKATAVGSSGLFSQTSSSIGTTSTLGKESIPSARKPSMASYSSIKPVPK